VADIFQLLLGCYRSAMRRTRDKGQGTREVVHGCLGVAGGKDLYILEAPVPANDRISFCCRGNPTYRAFDTNATRTTDYVMNFISSLLKDTIRRGEDEP
jgi:hypothetical protein